jgi:hypothetical protein
MGFFDLLAHVKKHGIFLTLKNGFFKNFITFFYNKYFFYNTKNYANKIIHKILIK